MKGYSRNREDYREKLVEKYTKNTVYTVSESKMKEALYIEGENCSKCHLTKPHAKKWAEENGYEFQNFLFSDAGVKEFQIESVPMLVLKENGEVKDILDMDGIVNLISKKD